MIDKYTFGNTPAAIYLADHLNYLGDPRLVRKAQKRLTGPRKILNELYKSHAEGHLSAQTLYSMAQSVKDYTIDRLVEHVEQPSEVQLDDLTINLIGNIIIGEVKSIKRRVQAEVIARISEGKRKKVDPKLHLTMITQVEDSITPELLIERSKKKLRRLNKPDSLY